MLLHKATVSGVGWGRKKEYASDMPTHNMFQLMSCQLLLFTRQVFLGCFFIC